MLSPPEDTYNQLITGLDAALRTPQAVLFEATAVHQRGHVPRPYPQYLSRIAFYDAIAVDLAVDIPNPSNFGLAVQADVNGLDFHRAQSHFEQADDEPAIVERKRRDGIRIHLMDWNQQLFTTWDLEIEPEADALHIEAGIDPFESVTTPLPVTPLEAVMNISKTAAPPCEPAKSDLSVFDELAIIAGMLGTASARKANEFTDVLDDYPDHRLINHWSRIGRLAQANFEALSERILTDDLIHRLVRATYEDATAA